MEVMEMPPRNNRPPINLMSPSDPVPNTNPIITTTQVINPQILASFDSVADHFAPSPTHNQMTLVTGSTRQTGSSPDPSPTHSSTSPSIHPVPSIPLNESAESSSDPSQHLLSSNPHPLEISSTSNPTTFITPATVETQGVIEPPMTSTVAPTAPQTHNRFNTIFGVKMPFDVLSAGFASLVAAGGLIGYLKAGSIPSLAAGLTFGGILGVGAYLTSMNPENYHLSFATSGFLGAFMGYRFINSKKFMPAGLIATLSVAMVIRYSIHAFSNNKLHSK